jgi:hypothetical protein
MNIENAKTCLEVFTLLVLELKLDPFTIKHIVAA